MFSQINEIQPDEIKVKPYVNQPALLFITYRLIYADDFVNY